MIIVGAYPDSFCDHGNVSSIQILDRFLGKIAPEDTPLHILPFNLHSGDGGFAQDDWFAVDPSLGTWNDIQSLASKRKLIVNAIYNHVGINHRFFRYLLNGDTDFSSCFFLYPPHTEQIFPNAQRESFREGSVLRDFSINGTAVKIWQTFPTESVDLNLECERVALEITRHVRFMRSIGVFGVRLDAPAYYGKVPGLIVNRHNDESIRLAREIVSKISDEKLHVIAELDVDEQNGQRYFPREMGFNVQQYDYSYPVNLLYSVLNEDPHILAEHVKSLLHLDPQPLRAPRTHDGILLRTPNYTAECKERLLSIAESFGIEVSCRFGEAHELNCSLPHILGLGLSEVEAQRRVTLTMAVTIAIPGSSYLYLPYVLGYKPEEYFPQDPNEPRALNRSKIAGRHITGYIGSKEHAERFDLIRYGSEYKSDLSKCDLKRNYSIGSYRSRTLHIEAADIGLEFYANFSRTSAVDIDIPRGMEVMCSNGWCDGSLEPLGFVFLKR